MKITFQDSGKYDFESDFRIIPLNLGEFSYVFIEVRMKMWYFMKADVILYPILPTSFLQNNANSVQTVWNATLAHSIFIDFSSHLPNLFTRAGGFRASVDTIRQCLTRAVEYM